jgi:hypothetical protein
VLVVSKIMVDIPEPTERCVWPLLGFSLPAGLSRCHVALVAAQCRMESLLPGHSLDSALEYPIELIWDRVPNAARRDRTVQADLIRIYDGVGQFRCLVALAGSGGRASPDFAALERNALHGSALVALTAVIERLLMLAVHVSPLFLDPVGTAPQRATTYVPVIRRSQQQLTRLASSSTAPGAQTAIVRALADDLFEPGSVWYGGDVNSADATMELRNTWAHGRDQSMQPISAGTVATLISAAERGFYWLLWTLCGRAIEHACPEWVALRNVVASPRKGSQQ